MSSAQNSLSFLALGGINEIGKNMYVIQYGEDMVVVDCGAKFSEHNILGVDLIIPDMSYLLEHQEKVKALIVTHGHEDHIGGIPYFLKKLNIPVYATSFTLGLIETKLKEHKILRESELHIITADSEITLGEMSVSFFRVSHSIPDCLGIVFDTPEGKVVHTGDFKFDLTPVNDQSSDIHKMAKMGDEGVLALISESTNAERPGMTPSEMLVGAHLEEAFLRAKQKIFISTFASNVNRVQQVVDACIRTNRKLALLGRSMVNVVQVARERGYLQMPDWMLVNARDVHEIPSERIAILCTGSQGEPLAALSRLSTNSNRDLKVHPGDTVILAASPIPGNEKDVSRVVDNLFRLGAHVIYGSASITGMHVSGHGYQEDLKLMLTLMKPKFFIPIHGEYRMLHIHRQLAETIGVEKDNTFILRNGDVVDIQDGTARQTRQVSAGDTYVDGYGIGEVGQVVLRDRKQLSEDGMLVIVVTVSKTDASLISAPEIISRGFVYAKDAEELMTTLADVVKETIENFKEPNIFAMKQALKKAVGQYISTHTKRKPLLLPIIIEF